MLAQGFATRPSHVHVVFESGHAGIVGLFLAWRVSGDLFTIERRKHTHVQNTHTHTQEEFNDFIND